MMIFCRKKQRTNAKSGGTKVADRKHVVYCRRIKIDAMIAVELGSRG